MFPIRTVQIVEYVSVIEYRVGVGDGPKEIVYPRISSSGDVSAISLNPTAIRRA